MIRSHGRICTLSIENIKQKIDFLTNFARYKRLKLYTYEKYIDSSVDGNIMLGASERVCAKPVAKHGHSLESLWREVATRADIRTSG